MKVYYAHSQAIYGTAQEIRDVNVLKQLGFEVVNPSDQEHQTMAEKILVEAEKARAKAAKSQQPFMAGKGSEKVMEYFTSLVEGTDAVAFRALPDGAIPAGVAKEIEWASQAGKPVIELPSGVSRRVITVEQTREYLKEIGQR